MRFRLVLIAVVTGLACGVNAQLASDEALGSFQLADENLRLELVASEPLIESPCAMVFDERGRLFVVENRGYPRTDDPPAGRIALLEDTDGDGRMDKRITFAEGLTFPNGVLPWQGGLIVTCAPDVLFLKDTDGDGIADEKRVLLTGFDIRGSTQLRVNAPTLGPDGWIWFAAGLSGGTITSPEHPDRPAVKMAGDIRWNPRTREIESVDGRSQYGMSFDAMGRRFICMNRLPVQHVVLDSKWLRRNPHLAFSETVQDCSERSVRAGLKGGGDGVRIFPISSNITTADSHAGSFSAACAVFIWRGGTLGKPYDGIAFSCDPTGNLVHADRLVRVGPTFAAEAMFEGREFLASRDDWFRPVFLANGPDGALYVCDMYRKVIEHPDYLPEEVRKRTDFESGKDMGRIWRVVPKDRKASALVNMADANAERLTALMDSDNAWVSATAERLLWEDGGENALKAVRAAIETGRDPGAQYRRVRMLGAWDAIELQDLVRWLAQENVGVRRAAIEETDRRDADAAVNEALLTMQADDDAVWFPHLLALGAIDDQRAVERLAAGIAKLANDRWVRAATLSGIGGREFAFLEAWAARAGHEGSGAELEFEVGRLIGSATPAAAARAFAVRCAERKSIALVAGFLDSARNRKLPVSLQEIDPAHELAQSAIRFAQDAAKSVEERIIAIRLLGQGGLDHVRATLEQLIDKESDAALYAAAVRALAGFPKPEAVEGLLEPNRWARASVAQRETILGALIASGHIEALLGAIEGGAVPASAINGARRPAFLKHKNEAIRTRAEQVFRESVAGRQEAFERAKGALKLTGSGERGREVFRNLCATCHRLDREGHALGPDLLDMRNQPKESILYHVVVPEAEVAPAFAAYVAETKDGRTLSGIMASETPNSITLRMPLAQEETILRSNIAKLEALPGSLMPALDGAMTLEALADLLAFLKGEK